MEINDRSDTLYSDPNAYIQNWNCGTPNNNSHQKHPQKIVFQEPYECVPDFYINNHFKKGNCDCVPKPKPKCPPPPPSQNFPFDFKNLLPILSGFMKNGNGASLSSLKGLGNILGMLNDNSNNNFNQENKNQNFDFSNLMKMLSNTGGLSNIFDLFKPKQKSTNQKKDIKSTDLQIKNYTRVE